MGFTDTLRQLLGVPVPQAFSAESSSLQQSLPTHEDWLAWGGFYPINPTRAMGLPGVFRANVLITDLAAQIDWHQERRVVDPDGTVRWERLADPHPIIRQPDLDEPPEETRAKSVSQLAARGESFFILDAHDLSGRPHHARLAEPADVRIQWGRHNDREYFYQDRPVKLWRDILHLKHLDVPGKLHGLGPIQAYARTLIGAGATEDWARTFFETGSTAPVVIKHSGPADEDEAKLLKEQYQTSHAGKQEPAVFFGGAELEDHQIKPDEAQALETRRWNVQMTGSAYGLNPYMLGVSMGGGSNITYQTLPDLFAEAVRLTIYPTYLRKHERVFSYLLPRHNRVRFDLAEFLRADEKTRMESAKTSIEAGVHTADEIRAREGLKPRKDPVRESEPAT